MAHEILVRLADDEHVSQTAATAERLLGRPVWSTDASLLSGVTGLALAFVYAARAFPDTADEWRAHARRSLVRAAESTRDAPLVSAGLGDGTAGFARVLAEAARDDARWLGSLSALHRRLTEQVDRLPPPRPGHVMFADYDVIAGRAGILGHVSLLPRLDGTERMTDRLVDDLVGVATAPDGDEWTRWLVPREHYPHREIEHTLYPYGYVDLGIAHGIPGPLSALSRLRLRGHGGQDLTAVIRSLASLLATTRRDDDAGRNWPRVMPVDRTGCPDAQMASPSNAAYCYGAPGICSALLDAAAALDDDALRHVAVDGIEATLRRTNGGQLLPEPPSVCHGIAGLTLIFRKFAQHTGSAAARAAVATTVEALVERCDPGLPLVVQDYKPAAAGMAGAEITQLPGGGWIDNPSLLEGAAGVALTLLSVSTPAVTGWSSALLID